MKIKTISNTPLNEQNIVIYTRNTSWEQPEGHRLHRSVQVLRDRYERAGYEISKIYYEPSTLTGDKERPALKKLLKDAANGLFGVVLVWDVFTLSSDGEELQLLERELGHHDVELSSATESFDTSTEEGRKVFKYMCHLLQYEHLASKQDIPLSALARLIITKGASMKGGKVNAESCIGFVRPA